MTDRRTWPAALSIHPADMIPAKLSDLSDSGIHQAELSMPFREDALGDFDFPHRFPEYRKNARELGVDITSVHLPYCPWDVSPEDPDGDIRKKTVILQCGLISAAADAGVDKCIMHPSKDGNPDDEREERLEFSMESVWKINEHARRCGVTLCLENLPRKCLGRTSGEMLMYLENIPGLRMVMDLNHSLLEDNVSFIHRVGKWIVSLHVSDYDLVDEKHMLPGYGKNDWEGILKTLEEENYGGRFLYELRSDYGYTYQEIAANYRKYIFGEETNSENKERR